MSIYNKLKRNEFTVFMYIWVKIGLMPLYDFVKSIPKNLI